METVTNVAEKKLIVAKKFCRTKEKNPIKNKREKNRTHTHARKWYYLDKWEFRIWRIYPSNIILFIVWSIFVAVRWFQLNQCWLSDHRHCRRQLDLALIPGVRTPFYVQTNADADTRDHNIVPACILNISCRVSPHHMYYSMLCHPARKWMKEKNVREFKAMASQQVSATHYKSTLSINCTTDNIQSWKSIFACQLNKNLLENRWLSKWEFTYTVTYRRFNVFMLALFVLLQHALHEQLNEIGFAGRIGVALWLWFFARLKIITAFDHLAHHVAQIMVFECHNFVNFITFLHFALGHQLQHLFHRLQMFRQCAKFLYIERNPHRMHITLDNKFMQRIEQNHGQNRFRLLTLDLCKVFDLGFRYVIVDACHGRMVANECGHLGWCTIYRVLCIWIGACLQQSQANLCISRQCSKMQCCVVGTMLTRIHIGSLQEKNKTKLKRNKHEQTVWMCWRCSVIVVVDVLFRICTLPICHHITSPRPSIHQHTTLNCTKTEKQMKHEIPPDPAVFELALCCLCSKHAAMVS